MTCWKIRPCFRSHNTHTRKCLKSPENPYCFTQNGFDLSSYQIRFGGDPRKPLRPNTIFFTMAPVRRRSATSRRLPRCRRALKSDPKKRCSENDYIYCYALFVCSSFGVLDLFFLAARPCFINNFFSLKKNEQKNEKKKELLFLRIHFCVIYYWLSSIRH